MIYDVAVVGGGPGGYVAAITAAQRGLSVVLIDRDGLGGTCLHRGCIPTKALLYCAGQYRAVLDGEKFGIQAALSEFNWDAAQRHKDGTVRRLARGVEQLVRGNGCALIRGTATLTSARTLTADGQTVEFKNLILATGSVPSPAPFPVEDGAPLVDSDGFLALTALPMRTVIVGGGVIGVEFATILGDLGREVTVVESLPRILSTMDEELAAHTAKSLAARGVVFETGTRLNAVEKHGGGALCRLSRDGREWTVETDRVVCAIGRRPNTAGLGLEAAGIVLNRGYIPVDDACRTAVPGIWAVGDVNGRVMLAHAASAQGRAVAQAIAGSRTEQAVPAIASCVYTRPELASVGLTEAEAREKGYDIAVGRCEGAGSGKLMTMGEAEGFVKLVTDRRTGEILGAQLCCAHATDLVSEVALAMGLEATAHELAAAVHPHPTVSEMLMEAAQDSLGCCVHKVYKKQPL